MGSSQVLFDEGRTFFCSELVAKAFKVMKVIENDKTSCTRFYPKHFSKEGDSFLKLKDGITIDVEKPVDIGLDDLGSIKGGAQSEYSHFSHVSARSLARYSHVSYGKTSNKSSFGRH